MSKSFFGKWKEGMLNITATQQLQAQLHGHIGSIFGLIFAWVFLVLKGLWYFSIVMFFAIWLSWVSFVGVRQKYLAVKEVEEEVQLEEVCDKL